MHKVKELISTELRTSMNDLKTSITDVYSESIIHLKNQIKKSKDRIAFLEETNSSLSRKLTEVESITETSSKQAETTKEDLSQIASKLESLATKLASLEHNTTSASHTQAENLRKHQVQHSKDLDSMTLGLENIGKTVQQIQTKITEASSKLKEDVTKDTEKKIELIRESLHTIVDKIAFKEDSLEKRENMIGMSLSTLSEKVKQIEERESAMKMSSLTFVETERKTLNDTINQMNKLQQEQESFASQIDKQQKIMQKTVYMLSQKFKTNDFGRKESLNSKNESTTNADSTKNILNRLEAYENQLVGHIADTDRMFSSQNETLSSHSKEIQKVKYDLCALDRTKETIARTQKDLEKLAVDVAKTFCPRADVEPMVTNGVTKQVVPLIDAKIQIFQSEIDSVKKMVKFVDSEVQIKGVQTKAEYQALLTRVDRMELKVNVLGEQSSSTKMVVTEPASSDSIPYKAAPMPQSRPTAPDWHNPNSNLKLKSQKEKQFSKPPVATQSKSEFSPNSESMEKKEVARSSNVKKASNSNKDLERIALLFSGQEVDQQHEDNTLSSRSQGYPREDSASHKSKSFKALGLSRDKSKEHIKIREGSNTNDRDARLSLQSIHSLRHSFSQEDGEITLLLDDEGYLIRPNGEYLTDDQGQRIRLSDEHVEVLKQNDQYCEEVVEGQGERGQRE